jgi:hypothetical protein
VSSWCSTSPVLSVQPRLLECDSGLFWRVKRLLLFRVALSATVYDSTKVHFSGLFSVDMLPCSPTPPLFPFLCDFFDFFFLFSVSMPWSQLQRYARWPLPPYPLFSLFSVKTIGTFYIWSGAGAFSTSAALIRRGTVPASHPFRRRV